MDSGSVPGREGAGRSSVETYILALAAFAAALAASWVYWYGVESGPRVVLVAALFGGFILLSSAFPIRVSDRWSIGTWDIGLMLAIVVLGPLWAAVAALPAAFLVGRGDPLRTTYEASLSTIAVFLAGMVFSLVSAPLLTGSPASPAPALYGAFTAAVVLLAVIHAVNAGLLRVKYGQGLEQTWRELVEPYLISDAVNVLTAGIGVLALLVYGPMAAVVAVGGAIASQVLVYRSKEQGREIRGLKERNRSLEDSLTTSNLTFGTMMIGDLGTRDGYTHRHAAATATYAADIARELQLDEARVERLRLAGLLHNIGMFGLPEELLRQTGKPNSLAQCRLSEHPARGQQALSAVPEFQEMASWVRWHHERPDGRGYPDKLRGPWIPLESRVLGVAQAYSALVLDQPRRAGVGTAKAREELLRGLGTEFDGTVVKAFLRILDTETEGYRMADDRRFLFLEPGTEKPSEGAPQQGLQVDR